MGKPIFFVRNFFSTLQYPDHVLAADSERTDQAVWRVGTGRRNPRDHWAPGTDNTASWMKVDCMASKSADMIALDRGHNLSGVTVTLEKSTDNFGANVVTVFSAVIPAASAANSDIDAANGATTEEGAWIKRFTSTSSRYWRLSIAAMGVNTRPKVVGLWLGEGWSLAYNFGLPWDDEATVVNAGANTNAAAWAGSGRLYIARQGSIDLSLASHAEYESKARVHLSQNFWRRRPMWIVYDEDKAERAVLGIMPGGAAGLRYDRGWTYRHGIVDWIEHEPKL